MGSFARNMVRVSLESPASADLATKGFRSFRFHAQQRPSAALQSRLIERL